MANNPLTVIAYRLSDGSCPFQEWHRSIGDAQVRRMVHIRVNRAACRNIGDCKPVGDGVHELRIPLGPGYRLYFTYDGATILLLLMGGDKSTQKQDIVRAKQYLTDYKKRKQEQF